jgi:site-specific recombinase XerD
MGRERHGNGSSDVASVVAADGGRLEATATVIGVHLIDRHGVEVSEVTEYLLSLLANGSSQGTLRSYAMALLRWWRFLAAARVDWDRASAVDVRDFVLWMRSVGGHRPAGYAPATINHNLTVLRAFYTDRIAAGSGPVVNPVPEPAGRRGQRPQAHHKPMRPPERHRRAPLRQKIPARVPRGLPDEVFDSLFATMGCDRDRSLLAFYVSTGARASELLGVTVDRVDVGRQLIGVHRKGSGRLHWLPASADAFVWLRLYQQHQHRPDGEEALWLTRRAPYRPLTYPAMRRILQRANDRLGTAWTLHDLRHTAARRMIADPALSLSDVQWMLGHAQLTTTQVYLQPGDDEVVARVLDHHQHRGERPAPPPPPVGGYRPEALRILFGSAAERRT